MARSKINKMLCKRCGAEGLEWLQTSAGWRLYKCSEPHTCPDIGSAPTVENPSVAEFAKRASQRGATRRAP